MNTKTHTTIDPCPKLSWLVPDGAKGAKYEFIVEIAKDDQFTQDVRSYSSQEDKTPFSFDSPREAGSGETVSIRIPVPLI